MIRDAVSTAVDMLSFPLRKTQNKQTKKALLRSSSPHTARKVSTLLN